MQLFTDPKSKAVTLDAQRAVQLLDHAKEKLNDSDWQIATNAMFQGWALTLNRVDKSPHTIKNLFSSARKIIGNSLAPEDQSRFLLFFKLDNANLGDVKAQQAARMGDRSFGMVTYDHSGIYIKTVSKFLASDDIDTAKVGLIAACGRRPSEVSASNFKRKGKKSASPLIVFDGQAKMRDRMVQPGGYEIPLLCKNAEFFGAVERWGTRLLLRTNPNLKPALETFAEAVEWPEAVPCNPKGLRGMYACMTYAMFAPPGQQEWKWVNEVLGHEPEDTTTPQTYMRFKVKHEADT